MVLVVLLLLLVSSTAHHYLWLACGRAAWPRAAAGRGRGGAGRGAARAAAATTASRTSYCTAVVATHLTHIFLTCAPKKGYVPSGASLVERQAARGKSDFLKHYLLNIYFFPVILIFFNMCRLEFRNN